MGLVFFTYFLTYFRDPGYLPLERNSHIELVKTKLIFEFNYFWKFVKSPLNENYISDMSKQSGTDFDNVAMTDKVGLLF